MTSTDFPVSLASHGGYLFQLAEELARELSWQRVLTASERAQRSLGLQDPAQTLLTHSCAQSTGQLAGYLLGWAMRFVDAGDSPAAVRAAIDAGMNSRGGTR